MERLARLSHHAPDALIGYDPKPMGNVEERALYKAGKDVSDWADAAFPKDEARANEFKAQFAQGLGAGAYGLVTMTAVMSIAMNMTPTPMAMA